jgi:hypothetical protein
MHPFAFTGLFFLLVLFAFAMPHMPPDHSEMTEEAVSEDANLGSRKSSASVMETRELQALFTLFQTKNQREHNMRRFKPLRSWLFLRFANSSKVYEGC